MFMHYGLPAVELLIGAAETAGNGTIEEYFNGFRFEEAGLFEWAEALITAPDLQCKEHLFGVLSGIKMALEHDRSMMETFTMVLCSKHTYGMAYPEFITAILATENYQSNRPIPVVFSRRICPNLSQKPLLAVTRTNELTRQRPTASERLGGIKGARICL